MKNPIRYQPTLTDKILAWITRKTPRLNNVINCALEEAYDLGYRDGMMDNQNRLATRGLKFTYDPNSKQGYGLS